MTKTRSALDRFKLYYEYLPSDEAVFELVRQFRAKKRKKDKADLRAFQHWMASSPKVLEKVVAHLRRVKR